MTSSTRSLRSAFIHTVVLAVAVLAIAPCLTIVSFVVHPESRPARAAVELKLDACAYSGSGATWTATTGPVNATLVGSPSWSSAEGGYFSLNGSSQYISVPHHSVVTLSTSSARTFQVWMKPTTLATTLPILGKLSGSYGWDGYLVYLTSSGYVQTTTNGSSIDKTIVTTTNAMSAGSWYLVTFVSQISSAVASTKVYVNSTNVLSTEHGNDGYGESNTLFIGSNAFSQFLHARIGAMYAYDRELSAAEITTTYNTLSNRVTSGGCTSSAPTVSSFTSAQSSPTNSSTFTYSLTFSEAVTGITAGDFSNAGSATGCSFDPGADTSSTSRTVTVSGCGEGTVQPRFAINGAINGSSVTGPASAATSPTTLTLDLTGPYMLNGSLAANGHTVTLNFDESVNSTTAPASAYRVTSSAVNYTPTSIAVSGSTVELTLPVNLEGGNAVTVGYTAPTSNSATSNAALQDTLGNDRPSFSGRNLTNNSTADGTSPTATWTSPVSPASSRTLSYTLTFSEPVSGISAGDFTIYGTSSSCVITPSAAGTSTSITVTVVCSSDGTVVLELAQNAVSDSSSNTGPSGPSLASSVTISTVNPATTLAQQGPSTPVTAPPVVASTVPPVPVTTTTTIPRSVGTTVAPTVSASVSTSTTTTSTSLPVVAPASTKPAPSQVALVEEFVGASVEKISALANEAENARGTAVIVNGTVVEVDMKTTSTSVTLQYLDARIVVQCFDKDGKKVALNGESRFVLRKNDVVRMTVSGFKPGSGVNIAFFSDPTALGTISIDANGDGLQQWRVPSTLGDGGHTLVISGDLLGVSNTVFGLRMGVNQPSLVARISSSAAVRILLVLAVLAGLMIPSSMRRKRTRSLH